jgi:hypothetical protein
MTEIWMTMLRTHFASKLDFLDIIQSQLKRKCTKIGQLKKVLSSSQFKSDLKINYQSSCIFTLPSHIVLIKLLFSKKDFIVSLVDNNFKEYKVYKFTINEINKILANFKQLYGKEFYNKMKQYIYYILRPQNNFTEDLKHFVEAYNDKFLYDFFDWKKFPLDFAYKSNILQNIILEKIDYYIYYQKNNHIREKLEKNEISVDSEIEIIPPIKALIRLYNKVKIDEVVIKEVRDYFYSCPDNQKDSVIKILNKIVS